MPTLSNSKVPMPKGWDEFEEITRSCLKIKWKNPNLTREGRPGQPQKGVDIHGYDQNGSHVGIQCKLAEDLSLSLIKKEIRKAESFVPKLSEYYIATTAPANSKLQEAVRKLSDERKSQGSFPVYIFFWEDLIQELITDEAEFQKHYPELSLLPRRSAQSSGNRIVSILHLGYLGSNLAHHLKWSGTKGGFIGNIKHLMTCVQVVMEGDMQKEVLSDLKKLLKNKKVPLRIITSVERNIDTLEYTLTERELISFKLGQYLGRWDESEVSENTYSKLPKKTAKKFLRLIEQLSPDKKVPSEIKKIFKEYLSEDGLVINAPDKVYRMVRSMHYEAIETN